MFFKAIAPACAKGISFNIKIEAADAGKLAVSITPASETGKSGFCLTPKQFVATPEEFDEEFSVVMAGFAATQQTLSQQLKAAEMVAEEVGKAATAAALETPKTSKPAPKAYSQPKKGNLPVAGMINSASESESENDDDGGDSGDGDNGNKQETALSSEKPAQTNVGGFDFDL